MSPYIPSEFDQSVNVSKVNPLKEAIRLMGGLIFLLFCAYVFVAMLINLALPHISVEWENKLWHSFGSAEEEEISPDLIEKQAYLQELVDSLPRDSKIRGYDFKVRVLEDEDINAYASPGGYVSVTSGLIDKINSENGLVFVLGHELGHFQNRDHLRGVGIGIITSLFSFALGDGMASRSLINKINDFTGKIFSRQEESDADLWGLKALHDHYGHVGGAQEFFDLIQEEEKGRGTRIEIFSTHPLTETRRQNMEAVIESNGWTQEAVRPFVSREEE